MIILNQSRTGSLVMIVINGTNIDRFVDNLEKQFRATGTLDLQAAAPKKHLGPSQCICPRCGVSEIGYRVTEGTRIKHSYNTEPAYVPDPLNKPPEFLAFLLS